MHVFFLPHHLSLFYKEPNTHLAFSMPNVYIFMKPGENIISQEVTPKFIPNLVII
jgi:hypothetical protein